MQKKKIFLFFGCIAAGGAERVACTLANNWSENGYDVHVVNLYQPLSDIYQLDDKVSRHVLVPYRRNIFLKSILLLLAMFRYRKLVKKHSPDVLLSFLTHCNIMTLLALWGLKLKIFVSDRGSPYRSYGWLQDHLRKWLYRYAHGIIAQTGQAKNELIRIIGCVNIAVIFNPLSPDFFQSSSHKSHAKTIIMVGRLIPSKGQKILIDVFKRIAEEHREWQLVLVGSGPEKEMILQQVTLEKLTERVILIEESRYVEELLANAEIFAFTSFAEGFPNALAEAMAMGMACVSFDCPAGPSDLIRNGKNGLLVKMGDTEQLYAALKRLVIDEEYRAKLGAHAEAVKNFLAPAYIAGQYLDFMLTRSCSPRKNNHQGIGNVNS